MIWVLGVDEDQCRDMLPESVSMGFPLVGDLGRFQCSSREDDSDAERRLRRVLLEEFRLAYPGVLEGREHAARRIVDPYGLWMFSKTARPGDLVVVHQKMGERREAVAIMEITGPYTFMEFSPWPHRLSAVTLNLDRWELPDPYSSWGNLFGRSSDDGLLLVMVEARTGRLEVDGGAADNPEG